MSLPFRPVGAVVLLMFGTFRHAGQRVAVYRSRAASARRDRSIVLVLFSVLFGALTVSPSALAVTVPGPAPTAGPAGLPDGRVYELVSPSDKNGYNAGASPTSAGGSLAVPTYTVATANGGAVFSACSDNVPCTMSYGTDADNFQQFSVSTRASTGWSTRGVEAPENQQVNFLTTLNENAIASADGSQVAIGAVPSFGSAPPDALDLFGAGGSVSWLSDPTITDPIGLSHPPTIAGASSGAGGGFDAIYFGDGKTLLPIDDQSNPAFGGASRRSLISACAGCENWGFYEWTPSRGLSYAGVLPNGTIDPYGAAPAAWYTSGGITYPTTFNANPVSTDGTHAFFVSPPPGSPAPASDPIELYARETASDGSQRTVLVSGSAVSGDPAPNGVLQVPSVGSASSGCEWPPSTADCVSPSAYASSDGSHVFFETTDALTSDAPNDGSVKEYEFDTDTNTLSYLPGVDDQQPYGTPTSYWYSPILASTPDGSSFLFVKESAGGWSLDVWSAGSVTPVAQFPEGGSSGIEQHILTEARAADDGSSFTFETNSPIYTSAPGEFNNAGGFEQIYRYDAVSGQLSCLSCGPAGLAHTGNANMSNDGYNPNAVDQNLGLQDARGISTDGRRVFFDSPDPLLPQVTNDKRNVYEWEAQGDGSCQDPSDAGGCLYLITSGQSADDSFYLDSSANGNDVFIATTQGLVPQDTDGTYDIYDARVGGGFAAPAGPAPCSGDACQAAATEAPSLPLAGTVSFTGPGDQTSSARTAAKLSVTRKLVRGTRFVLNVRVPTAGRITITGADVNTVTRSIVRSGVYKVAGSLTRGGRNALKRRRGLRVKLRLEWVPTSGTASRSTTSITLNPQAGR